MRKKLFVLLATTFISTLAVTQTALAQGSLTPPSGPEPMMKTLDQIEPRIPIGVLGYTITNSGSYYLTRNLGPSLRGSSSVIVINANDVTLDLNGHVLDGSAVLVDRTVTGVL